MRQTAKELIEFLLPVSEFTSAAVVDAEASHDTIDDEQTILIRLKAGGQSIEEF